MITIKNHKQMDLLDPWGFLSPKRRKLLDNSWAGLFKDELLCELPVSAVKPFFNEGFGRPSKELHTALGVLILQQMFDMPDQEAISNLAFNIQWHYALNISEESDSAKYIAPKTLWNWRSIVTENALDFIIFDSIANKLCLVFDVDTDYQRLDSVHIKSNMRRLGRITIFVQSINKFLVNLRRGHKDRFETIDADIISRYLPEKSLKVFSLVKPSESSKTLDSVARDLLTLVRQFDACSEITTMHTYKLLERVLKEQCDIVESEEKSTAVEIKEPKEIPSDSLQNPSDPDATYSGHKGQGFQAQIMETYSKKDEGDKKDSPNFITYVHVEPSHESDANALISAVESTQKRNLGPEEVLADSLYGSDENCQKAKKEFGVDVVSPTMGTRKDKEVSLSDFELSDQGAVVSCPQGHEPVSKKHKKGRHCAAFDSSRCCICPLNESCPVKQGKKQHYLRYTDKSARIAKRRAYESTEEFKDRYRWRAGVEATMSELDRKTGAKHLRIRGLQAVRFCVTLKATAINIFRATAARNTRKTSRGGLKSYINIVKELFDYAIMLTQTLKNGFSGRLSFFKRT